MARFSLFGAFIISFSTTLLARFYGVSFPYFLFFDELFNKYLSFNYALWFLLGVLVYDLYRKKTIWVLLIAVIVGIIAAVHSSLGHHDFTVYFSLLLIILFISSVYLGFVRRVFSGRLIVFMGFISYPFYLLHENFVVAMIVKKGCPSECGRHNM